MISQGNDIWQGRFDGDDALQHRIWQRVSLQEDYETISTKDFVLHGFAVDEGVRRNKGKIGAAGAPNVIRKNMANFPVVKPDFTLKDFGDVIAGTSLEVAQSELTDKSAAAFIRGGKSVVLGGGHEVTYAHYSGLRKAFPGKKIGIINIDAHFDNREPELGIGASSGTGFWQIAQEGPIHSLHIGIQRNSNTLKLFDTAHQYGMGYITADEIFFENLPGIYEKIDDLISNIDVLYLTVCMDVFNAAVAPGVSALAYNGIFADAAFMHFYRHILQSEKMMALDVAEVNPSLDPDQRTARLAAALVNEWLMI